MSDDLPKPKGRRTESVRPSAGLRSRDPKRVRKFLEELGWLLSSYPNLDFRALASTDLSSSERNFGRHVSKNPNIHFLIGVLPVIFTDETYFGSNEDISEFAREALGLAIARWEKRSRYELIGLIVCETAKLNDIRLERLVNALGRIVSADPRALNLFEQRKSGSVSWNEIIQQLSQERRE
jgi:hypothetical protein